MVKDHVHLEVKDNGFGMRKEVKEKDLDRFFRGYVIAIGTGWGNIGYVVL
ncbi:hypothetical protein [Xanthovirga aplysinae]|nr:hypothetical protein [Xanthovirga aplysinae]MTI31594.1 HAMP domain-containing histidine kinase [Xanthovirga aplysinae]